MLDVAEVLQKCWVLTRCFLQVFSMDFATAGASPTVRGSVAVPERFSRLTWGAKPSEQANLPVSSPLQGSVVCTYAAADVLLVFVQYGIIAGGLSDGTICLWNPAPLVAGTQDNPLLSKLQKHSGAVSVRPAQLQLQLQLECQLLSCGTPATYKLCSSS